MTKQNQIYFDCVQFSKDIDKIRENRKVTYRNIAKDIGVSLATVHRVMNYENCSTNTVFGFCIWAGLNPNDYIIY